tara:strand:- start:770 stop:961 length:192 start_codon:yes stop_codon:yes gene_type:complete
MLRFILLAFLIFGIGSGLRDGWLIIRWSQLLHNVGFTFVDPDQPFVLSEFIIDLTEKDSSKSN